VLVAEALHVVAELGEGGGGGGAREPGAHHDHRVLPLVRGVHELHLEAVLLPFLLDRSRRDVGLELHAYLSGAAAGDAGAASALSSGSITSRSSRRKPASTATGNVMLPTTTSRVRPTARPMRSGFQRG